jgi:hypothetical protein
MLMNECSFSQPTGAAGILKTKVTKHPKGNSKSKNQKLARIHADDADALRLQKGFESLESARTIVESVRSARPLGFDLPS